MDILQSLTQTWKALTAAQRVGTILIVLAAAGVLAGMSYFGNRVEYRSLSTGDPTKIGEMATLLESAGIKPKVSVNTLQVPVDRYDESVLIVAKSGWSADGPGFDLLDKGTNAFTTSLLEKVNVQRAVAGELERILRSYPGIAAARVLMSQDQETWRSKSEKDGTASVSVTTRNGINLTAADVAAIQSCVANAWHSLRPENVSVMANGKKLTRDIAEGNDRQFAMANNQLMAQVELEETLRRRAQDALDHAQGVSKTYITINADLNFDSKSEKIYTVDPDKVVVKKEESQDSIKSNGDGGGSGGGVTGVSANSPAENKSASSADTLHNSDKKSTTERAFSYTDRMLEKRGFEVKRLSIALFVDQTLKSRLSELEKTVKAAVGFDDQRGDQFSATAESDFAKAPDVAAPPAPVSSSNIPELISTGGRIGALVGLILLFLVLLRRANRSANVEIRPMAPPGSPEMAGVGSPRGNVNAGIAPAATGPMGGVAAGTERTPEDIARQGLARSAAAAASSDPAAAGRVVRTWLEEKRR
ncbi:MAG: hypothetical protein HY286_07050 [Planctomycetes bacterium]|nr:hypothetical protein [Planctomycetota bacterium]